MIKSRSELHNQMERTMNANLRSLDENGEYTDYNVKTNIIESNCKISDIPSKFDGYTLEIMPTTDKFLYIILAKNANKEKFTLYLDAFFDRYWKLYNMEKSETISKFMDKFTNLLAIDSLWMPHQMLTDIEKKLDNIGFSIKFRQEVFGEDELGDDEVSQLTMRLWSKGSKPSKELFELLHKNNFPAIKTSTRLINRKDGETKFLDEVFFDGRITVNKGTDIEEHIHFVDEIIDDYSAKMNQIEEQRISLEEVSGGFKINGSPLELKFSKRHNIEKLAEKLINSTKPFRLWGVIHDHTNDFLRISGVDTHTGDNFNLDLMPEYARLYLPKKSCGNLVFRLYTNVQHSLDPGVIICDEHGSIF
jgi:hypothetical protein